MVIVGVEEPPAEATHTHARLTIAWPVHGGGGGYGREHTDARRASLQAQTHRTPRHAADHQQGGIEQRW